ncbi:hypothetical protein HMPREF1991_03186 [Hoylesella loescheii DSM 19665 = JCM 12249 = ATCC 15930]|uniref:Uncharacterized protein n=1 Tax=Hoylesella loescheii DSM 19665 = JCM 12249 = ATCC 15930 TaxID=1122985 RepID=A0A069QFH9_HOYLO|nr:hypothetical protein HMPREF1991_03186 [Hoylesella loescheii DSM 19665 = JCM 12249 = ATCC 15930]
MPNKDSEQPKSNTFFLTPPYFSSVLLFLLKNNKQGSKGTL